MLRFAAALTALCSIACGSSSPSPEPPPPKPRPTVEPTAVKFPATPIADQYQKVAQSIIETALASDAGFDKLQHLTDRIGHRLSGSKSLERAVVWAAQAMEADKLEVRLQKVMVPHWIRGEESARMIAPAEHELAILGLGGTVGTPKKGITAEVITAASFEELEKLGDRVDGKIVLYTHAMHEWNEETGSGYGSAVDYRYDGPSRAAKQGAVAVLIRSLTATSLSTPHTGSLGYDEEVAKIPAAAVSIEGAELIERLIAKGETVKVQLSLGAKMLPDAESHNVIAEIRGSEAPDEVVVLGAHLDSWDVGAGAHDDGAGCAIMMQAAALIRAMDKAPRRTIRVVLYTNEENGLRGAKEYAAGTDTRKHVMALESDSGGFAPRGFTVQESDIGLSQMVDIVTLLEPLDAARAKAGFSGADLIPLAKSGVPTMGLWVHERHYFDYHHTEADTLDKVDANDLRKNVAAVAVIAYVIADMPNRFGQRAK